MVYISTSNGTSARVKQVYKTNEPHLHLNNAVFLRVAPLIFLTLRVGIQLH